MEAGEGKKRHRSLFDDDSSPMTTTTTKNNKLKRRPWEDAKRPKNYTEAAGLLQHQEKVATALDPTIFNGFLLTSLSGTVPNLENFQKSAFKQIREACDVIFKTSLDPSVKGFKYSVSKETMHRLVRNLFEMGCGESLYNELEKCINSYHAEIFGRALAASLEDFVRIIEFELFRENKYLYRVYGLKQLFLPLDFTLGFNFNAMDSFRLSTKLLADRIEAHRDKLANSIAQIVRKHRAGDDQKDFLDGTLQAFLELDAVQPVSNSIVDTLIKKSEEHFQTIYGIFPEDNTKRIEILEKCFAMETEIAGYFSGQMQTERLLSALATVVFDSFGNNLEALIQQCLDGSTSAPTVLRCMYTLSRDSDQLHALTDAYVPLFKKEVLPLLQVESNSGTQDIHVTGISGTQVGGGLAYENQVKKNLFKILEVTVKFQRMIGQVFEDDPFYYSSLAEALEQSPPSFRLQALLTKLVPEYLDDAIRSESRVNANKLGEQARAFATLLSSNKQLPLLPDNYSILMGKRLLSNGLEGKPAAVPLERERIVLDELKKQLPLEVVIPLSRMHQDAGTKSAQLHSEFRCTSLAATVPLDLSTVKPLILNQQEWPAFINVKEGSIILPKEIRSYEEAFEEFYKSKYGDLRQISWPVHLGTWTIRAKFKGGVKEIVGSKLQITVLLLFRELLTLSLGQIQAKTGIGHRPLEKVLGSLVHHKLLLNEDDENSYTWNRGFTCDDDVAVVNNIRYEDTLDQAVNYLPPLDRHKKEVQAAIVWLMKGAYNAEKPEDSRRYSFDELYRVVKESPQLKLPKEFSKGDMQTCLMGLESSKHLKKSGDAELYEYIP